MEIIYSESEKRAVLNALSKKGHKKPANWLLLHKEEVDEKELKFNYSKLIDALSKKFNLPTDNFKFEIDVVSNPNETSRLDNVNLKVRFRYVLKASHQHEPKIKSNSREFCIALINQNKLFRIEDINMMSFRGVNPIAKKNYSIFKLRGHWNCRHTWQREVYLVERDNAEISNNVVIQKTLEMSNKNQTGLVEKFKAMLGGKKVSISDAVKLAEAVIESTDGVFKDFDVEGKTLRVEGDEVKTEAVVAWVNEDGSLSPVTEAEVVIENEGKKIVLTIVDSAISEIKDFVEATGGNEGQFSEDLKEGDEIKIAGKTYVIKDGVPVLKEDEDPEAEKFSKFKAEILSSIESKLNGVVQGQADKFSAVMEEIKRIPALDGKQTKQDFGGQGGSDNRYSALGGKPLN